MRQQLVKMFGDSLIEEVALILEDDEIIELENISLDPENNFKFRTSELENRKVKTIFHTHVKDHHPGEFTLRDILECRKIGIPFLLYHTLFKEWDYFDPNGIHPYPFRTENTILRSLDFYLNWVWQWGRCDCFTILRSFFRGFLEIEIGEFQRKFKEKPSSPTWNRFQENFHNQGFYKVEDLRKYDVLLFNILGNPNGHHVAVYIGENQFLHVYDKHQPSHIETLSEYFSDRLVSIWRHKDVSKVTW